VCEEANPLYSPVPPPRDNPPSRRRGSHDSAVEATCVSTSALGAMEAMGGMGGEVDVRDFDGVELVSDKPSRQRPLAGGMRSGSSATLPARLSLQRSGSEGTMPTSPLGGQRPGSMQGGGGSGGGGGVGGAASPAPGSPGQAAARADHRGGGGSHAPAHGKSPGMFRRWTVTASRARRKTRPGGSSPTKKMPPVEALGALQRDRSASASSIDDGTGIFDIPGGGGWNNSTGKAGASGGKGRLRAGTVIGQPFNFQHLQHYGPDGHRSTSMSGLPTTSASPPSVEASGGGGGMRMPNWLSPGISRREAAEALAGQAAGTFLVRASKTQPGSFAICVVQPSGRYEAGSTEE